MKSLICLVCVLVLSWVITSLISHQSLYLTVPYNKVEVGVEAKLSGTICIWSVNKKTEAYWHWEVGSK